MCCISIWFFFSRLVTLPLSLPLCCLSCFGDVVRRSFMNLPALKMSQLRLCGASFDKQCDFSLVFRIFFLLRLNCECRVTWTQMAVTNVRVWAWKNIFGVFSIFFNRCELYSMAAHQDYRLIWLFFSFCFWIQVNRLFLPFFRDRINEIYFLSVFTRPLFINLCLFWAQALLISQWNT